MFSQGYEKAKQEQEESVLKVGFSNSMFQSSGDVCGPSNWTRAAALGTVQSAGKANNHWDLKQFREDLDLMASLGVNSYRFSIEWSQIEKVRGRYSQEVIGQYGKRIQECLKRNITPIITLHHFTEPLWFSNEYGFEKEENISFFVKFCHRMFESFPDVKYWCTINEPAIEAFSGYLYGQFPPHEHNLQKTVTVLKNLLKAHVEVYHELKQMPGGDKAQIGIVHNPLKFIPRYDEPIETYIARFLTQITNDSVMNFLKTGKWDYEFRMSDLFNRLFFCMPDTIKAWLCDYLPEFLKKYDLVASEHYYDPRAKDSYDFSGVNYYGLPVIGPNRENFFGPTCFSNQTMSEMYLPIDKEGFENVLDEFAKLGKPILITEIGFAGSDKLRAQCLREYFDVIKEKQKEGMNILGVLVWTLISNYEWNEAYTKKFGLFDKNDENESVKLFKEFITHCKNNVSKQDVNPTLTIRN